MLLQTNLTTRRQFLQRSMLGFGSALVLPSLLAACTDHRIPTPVTPVTPPHLPSAAPTPDWIEAAKAAILTGLGQKPEAGKILGDLASILWPSSGQDVWDSLRDQVQSLLGKNIPDSVYTDLKTTLNSLKALIDKYLTALTNSTPTEIGNEWGRVTGHFVTSQPYFTIAGYEVLLLPFFAQFANLYLSLLRDGVAFGQSWGRTDADHQQDIKDLQAYIQGAVNGHTTGWYANGRATVVNNTKQDDLHCEPFRSVNTYERGMTLLALDFMNTWPYFDVSQYANGVRVVLTREIYSDPFGACSNSGPIVIKTPVPTQFPTQIAVWGSDYIDAFQVTYPYYSGPGGVTTTDAMGNTSIPGSDIIRPHGNNDAIHPGNPITQFRVVESPLIQRGGNFGPYVLAMQFQYADGTLTNLLGGASLPPDWGTDKSLTDTGMIGYGHNALSSVHVNGLSTRLNTADGIVLGFQYWPPQ